MCHVPVHGVRGVGVYCQHCLELIQRHGVETQVVLALEGLPVVRNLLLQDTQIPRTTAVLSRRYFSEIIERPVELVAVDVVDLHAFCAWSDKGLIDEMMTESVGVLSHHWIRRMHVWSVLLRVPRIGVFDCMTGSIVEAAVRAAE